MDATERFKALYLQVVERLCVLEEQLEIAQGLISEQRLVVEEQQKLIKSYKRKLKIKHS